MAERVVVKSVVLVTPAELGIRPDTRFTSHGGTTVIWNDGSDDRVLNFIDQVPALHRRRLLAVAEDEGCVDLVWDGPPPAGYCRGDEVVVRLGATGEAIAHWRISASADAFGAGDTRAKFVGLVARGCRACGAVFSAAPGSSEPHCETCRHGDAPVSAVPL